MRVLPSRAVYYTEIDHTYGIEGLSLFEPATEEELVERGYICRETIPVTNYEHWASHALPPRKGSKEEW